MPTKLERLENLRDEHTAVFVDPWYFPNQNGVWGYQGCSDIMIIGERPSMGHFGGVADRYLYQLLGEFGAGDAHITDVIKERARNIQPI